MAAAESLNSKMKGFRAQLHGIADIPFFLYRVCTIFGKHALDIATEVLHCANMLRFTDVHHRYMLHICKKYCMLHGMNYQIYEYLPQHLKVCKIACEIF